MALPSYRLSLPAWMLGWPEPLRPAALRVDPAGLRLGCQIDHPEGQGSWRWLRARPPSPGRGWSVQPEPHAAQADAAARRAEALQARLDAEPAAAPWALAVRTVLGAIERARDSGPLGALLIHDGHEPPPLSPAALAAAGKLDPAARVGLSLASGDAGQALALGEAVAATLAGRRDLAAASAAVLAATLAGQRQGASRLARERLVPREEPAELHWASETLLALGLGDEGCEAASRAASRDPAQAYALATAAARARRPERAVEASERLPDDALPGDQLGRLCDLLIEAGAFDEAERRLALATEARPGDGALWARRARLALWRGDAARAQELARRASDAGADPDELREIRGAAAALEGDAAGALAHLGALAGRPGAEARLWRIEALLLAGRLDEARAAVKLGGYADQAAWQLLRARLLLASPASAPPDDVTLPIARTILVDQHGRDAFKERLARGEEDTMLREALARLGGNRSRRATYAEGGRLVAADDLVSPRTRAEQVQRRLDEGNAAEVLAEFERLRLRYPEVPFFATYAAELRLWSGDYEGASMAFDALWRSTGTRWAYVGSGAARMFLGRHDEALARWDEGSRALGGFLPREATYAYRGELWRRRGDLDRAHADFLHAATATDSRLFAWIGLALASLGLGRRDEARSAAAHAARLAPALLREARGPDASDDASTLGRALAMLRGNAASQLFTFYDRAGSLRVLPAQQAAVAQRLAARCFPLWRDALVEALLARQLRSVR